MSLLKYSQNILAIKRSASLFHCYCTLFCVYVDAQDGVLVLLPSESQQRLVQLLYFLPKMSQPLLVHLSCCCTAGRITAGLATSLIRIVHLRYNQKSLNTDRSDVNLQ